ncbi:uncharacterized protein [Pseudorasbora parva]|uniref:uncharacterized protein n=1 Tax=Pseudorasbora parva TaxID=51549 RepID=UPI00351EE9D9
MFSYVTGYTIHRCGLGCRSQLHYHCMYCQSMLLRKEDFKKHLTVCQTKQSTSVPLSEPCSASTVPCPPSAESTSVPLSEPCSASTVPCPPSAESTSVPLSEPCSASTVPCPPSAESTSEPSAESADHGIHAATRVHVRPVVRERCPMCNVVMNKRNIRKHIDRKHTNQVLDVNSKRHLRSECIDEVNGIYSVQKTFLGHSVPLHVQNKTWGENHRVTCESQECQGNMDLAWRSGIKAYRCVHLRSVTYCTNTAKLDTLREDSLAKMVQTKWFTEETRKNCLARQSLSRENNVPLSVCLNFGFPQIKKIVSVFEPTVSYYSVLRRVMVVYNTKLNSWHCPCSKTKRSCPHIYVAKWHFFQEQPELFRTVRSTEEAVDSVGKTDKHECLGGTEEGVTSPLYPPKGDGLSSMVKYILKDKKLPAVLPDHLRLPSKELQYPKQLVPEEMICQRCPGNVPLSEPILITDKARILTSFGIIEDVSTYCKRCPVCALCYRYQEWKDGVHNFSDRILLDLPLCVSLRNLLQVHTAVSRAVDYLQLTTGVKFPSKDAVLHAYLHFEALTDHDYNYSCVTCGDHPAVVIMDLHKKGAFHLSISDLEDPPESYNGEVDCDMFWNALAMEMIGRGFVKSSKENPFLVPPSYNFWAPWIGPRTRSDIVLNTEFAKIHAPKSAAEVQEITVTEDRLTDELSKQKVGVLRKLCRECGLDATGSRNDILLRISREMKSRHAYDKIFQKIWAASGGWAVVLCPCGIVYSIKHNIRSESPRDFADILLSWRHMPNVAIYDFARGLATHTNLREPEKVPFSPFEGRLLAPSAERIALAKQGKVKVSLPWLESSKIVPDRGGHPVTGSAEHYCLYDKFHEANTKDDRDLLRKISLVPQLAGKVNSQVAEQFFAKLKKNNYFLNMSQPSTHVFLMRNIVHHMNTQKNNARLERIQKTFGVEVSMNIHGQAVMGTAVSTEIPTEVHPTQMPISVETFPVCGDECRSLTSLDNICTTNASWNFTLHAGQKALV